MNKTPSILVDTGFEVDQNGALTEIDVPNVVTTFNAPTKIMFSGTALNFIPSTKTGLQEIDCPNMTSIGASALSGYTGLITASFSSITALGSITTQYSGTFYGCTALQTVNLSSVISISSTKVAVNNGGHFKGCAALTTVNMPLLETIGEINDNVGSGHFYGCTSLSTLTLPHVVTIGRSQNANSGQFYGCTALTEVQLGSEGHPVTSIGNYTFNQCTQSGLTITIYTSGGAALSGSPWGATNATIVYEEA